MRRPKPTTQTVEAEVDFDYTCPDCGCDLYCINPACKGSRCENCHGEPDEQAWRPGQIAAAKALGLKIPGVSR